MVKVKQSNGSKPNSSVLKNHSEKKVKKKKKRNQRQRKINRKKILMRSNKKPITPNNLSNTATTVPNSNVNVTKKLKENNIDKTNELSSSTKKDKKKNKKKTMETENTETYKTVVDIQSPADYSANWKHLQKILNKETLLKTELKNKKLNNDNIIKRSASKTDECKPTKKRDNSSLDANTNIPSQKRKKTSTNEIWFDNVDPILIKESLGKDHKQEIENNGLLKPNTDEHGSTGELIKDKSFEGATKIIAMDCEMVGVGFDGKDSILARVSIVNHFGHVLYDKFVKPTEEVTDYRTHVSGIRRYDIEKGEEFSAVQKAVSELLGKRTLVGHALKNDLKTLFLSHSKRLCRDTSRFKPFKKLFGGSTPSLKNLAKKLLNIEIQSGEHSSIQDAQAAMRLYTLYRKEWEVFITKNSKKKHVRMKKAADNGNGSE